MRRRVAAWGGALAVAAFACHAVTALSAPTGAAATDCTDADLVPDADNLGRVDGAVLCLIDQERVRAHLVPLARRWRLDRSSLFHSAEMVQFHFLAHEAAGRPTLLARIRGYGYFNGASNGLYAENVGVGPGSNGTPRALINAWMASPGHRANLLYPPFRDVGIAAVLAPPDPAFYADFPSTVYTTDFGRRYVRVRCTVRRRPPSTGGNRGSASPRVRYCRPSH